MTRRPFFGDPGARGDVDFVSDSVSGASTRPTEEALTSPLGAPRGESAPAAAPAAPPAALRDPPRTPPASGISDAGRAVGPVERWVC